MGHRVIGLRLTQTKLAALGVHVEEAIPLALRGAAQHIADDARENLSGHRTAGEHKHLADDIKVGPIETKGGRKGTHFSIKIGPSAETGWRARFLEWGTAHMSAIPFLRPARSKNRKLVKDMIRANAAVAVKGSRIG